MSKKPSSESRRKVLHDAIIRRGGAHVKTTKNLRPGIKVKLKKGNRTMKIKHLIEDLEHAKPRVDKALEKIQDRVIHLFIHDGIICFRVDDARISGGELVVDSYGNGDLDKMTKRIPPAVFEAENPLEAYKKFLVYRNNRENRMRLTE